MKNLFYRSLETANTNIALLFLRLTAALLIFTHGLPKLNMLFSDQPVQFMDVLGMGMILSLGLSAFAEGISSVLVFFGLATRIALIPLVINMLVAAFYVHADDPFATKEKALLFSVIFISLLISGPGKYSLDHLFMKRVKK